MSVRNQFLPLLLVILVSLLIVGCTTGARTTAPPPPLPTVAPLRPTPTFRPSPTLARALPPSTLQPGADIPLTVICRCVSGGVNANMVKYLTETVWPRYEDAMRKAGKNVKVTLIEYGGSDEEITQQLALDLRVGQGADVMFLDGFRVPEFAASGLLKPLDVVVGPQANAWEGWSHIPRSVQDILGYQGRRYGIPTGTDARAIWYRRDILKAAGLPDAWQPKSWDELLDAARAVKRARPDVTPLQINAGAAMGEATTFQGWYMVVLGAGANVYSFDSGRYIVRGRPLLDALNFYRSIYVEEKLGDDRLQTLKDGRQRSFLDFRDGKIAMLVESDYMWRSVLVVGETRLENRDQLVGWAKMPAMAPGQGIRGQNFVTASGGTGWVINPHTRFPAEAWALATTANSKDNLDEFQKLEPRIRARDDVPVPNDPVLTSLAKELLPLTTIRPSEPSYPRVSAEIQLMTERVVTGEMTPQQALDAYARAVTDIAGSTKVEDAK